MGGDNERNWLEVQNGTSLDTVNTWIIYTNTNKATQFLC